MKVIFLDIDGTVNVYTTKETFQGYIGLDDKRLDYLKQIIDSTGAVIVLSSTWRLGYNKDGHKLKDFGDYLKKKFTEHGLEIYDVTPDHGHMGLYRGAEIKDWLSQHDDVENFIIIDDENFDFSYEKLGSKWIQTQYYRGDGGIQPKHVKRAIKMLNENTEKEKESN